MARFADQLDRFFYRPDEELPQGVVLPDPVELPAARAAEIGEYLCFRLGEEAYGVPIPRVREVLRVPPLTEVPRAPANVVGVMNLRGEVLPVYDLKLRLRLAVAAARIAGPEAAEAPARGARVIVVRSDRGDAGLLVDAVEDVWRLAQQDVEPTPKGTSERDGIVGLGRQRDRLCILLDVEQVLA